MATKQNSPIEVPCISDERIVPEQNINIEPLIRIIRNQQVILVSDLALLYGVETKRLNEQVKRNIDRFPDDFMFQLNKEEAEASRSHFATLNGRGSNIKHLPYAFTENGIIEWSKQPICCLLGCKSDSSALFLKPFDALLETWNRLPENASRVIG